MNRTLHRTDTLAVLAALAAGCVLAAPGVLAVPAGLALAFVLPGAALTALAFPGRLLSLPEQATVAAALSLAVLVLGGLAANVAGAPLTRPTWTAVTTGVVLLSALAVRWRTRHRRRPPTAEQDAGQPATAPPAEQPDTATTGDPGPAAIDPTAATQDLTRLVDGLDQVPPGAADDHPGLGGTSGDPVPAEPTVQLEPALPGPAPDAVEATPTPDAVETGPTRPTTELTVEIDAARIAAARTRADSDRSGPTAGATVEIDRHPQAVPAPAPAGPERAAPTTDVDRTAANTDEATPTAATDPTTGNAASAETAAADSANPMDRSAAATVAIHRPVDSSAPDRPATRPAASTTTADETAATTIAIHPPVDSPDADRPATTAGSRPAPTTTTTAGAEPATAADPGQDRPTTELTAEIGPAR